MHAKPIKKMDDHFEQPKARSGPNDGPSSRTRAKEGAGLLDVRGGRNITRQDSPLARIHHSPREEDSSDTEEVDWEEHSSVGGSSSGSDEGEDPTKRAVLFQGGQGPVACWYITGRSKAWEEVRPPGVHESSPGGIWGSGTGCGLPKCACTLPQLRGEAEEAEEREGYNGDDEGPIQRRRAKRLAKESFGEAGTAEQQAHSMGLEPRRKRRKVLPGKVHRGYEEGLHVQHGQARGHHLRIPEEDDGVRGHGPFKRASGASAILSHGGTEERVPFLR